ncbi:E3 ubiquitin-protein ligase ATL23-like [Juglans microcarpa x Juglans regia]|uniref:E3 ubiquitin-protein ligase ATL23-like n=1 Tax=Juglans microcarpa x Juglans regia TaxID=2249226 RepID=UPI001B7E5F27|nr:E3 ubiquitin-protein ligase ATL23-like [Juglans microcarpa x Juglans regia]
MIVWVFLALFLPCAGTIVMYLFYICLLWYVKNSENEAQFPVKPATQNGLSVAELEKLPKVTGKELVLGTECAVCLDEIENGQLARLIPGCNHGFHVECADTWLSKHSACPVCRSKLESQFFNASDQNPC